MAIYDELMTEICEKDSSKLSNLLERINKMTPKDRFPILSQPDKDRLNYLMLAMAFQKDPQILSQCLQCLDGLSQEQKSKILTQTDDNGKLFNDGNAQSRYYNYLMLAMRYQKDPEILSQCLQCLDGLSQEQKSKILTQRVYYGKNWNYDNYLVLAIWYQKDPQILSQCLQCLDELSAEQKSKILTLIGHIGSKYRLIIFSRLNLNLTEFNPDVLLNFANIVNAVIGNLISDSELREHMTNLLDKIYNKMEKDDELPHFYYKLAKSSNLVDFFKTTYRKRFWSNGDQHFILAMKALIASKTMPNDLPEDFFPVLIGFAEQTNHDDLAKHFTVKSYFPIIRCDDLDKSTIESIIANQQDYQKIYKIVTMDYSDQDIIDSKIQYYINELATLATKCTNVKDLFSGLDNTCPLIKKIADYYTNISDSPQFDLDLDSSLTKVGLLIDLCETMGWKTDKLTFEKIKENLESDRPSSNPELGL